MPTQKTQPHHPTIEDIFEQLLAVQDRTEESFKRLEDDVRELRDNRYRPYFASAGAFLAITLGVVGYIYSLETRLTSLLFTMNSQVNVTQERINVLESRLKARTESMQLRWDTHVNAHDSISEGMRILVEKLLDDKPPYKLDIPENEESD
jgi:hypothetical protein